MWKDSAPYDTNVNQNLAPDFGFFDNTVISWSNDDQLDPSLLDYDFRMTMDLSGSASIQSLLAVPHH